MTNKDQRCFFRRNFLLSVTAGVLLLVTLLPCTMAQSLPPQPTASKPPGSNKEVPGETSGHELSASDIESFLDGLMPLQLAREDIAGAVISKIGRASCRERV